MISVNNVIKQKLIPKTSLLQHEISTSAHLQTIYIIYYNPNNYLTYLLLSLTIHDYGARPIFTSTVLDINMHAEFCK